MLKASISGPSDNYLTGQVLFFLRGKHQVPILPGVISYRMIGKYDWSREEPHGYLSEEMHDQII